MVAKAERQRFRRAVGIFHEAARMQAALRELVQLGVRASDLSMLARRRAIEAIPTDGAGSGAVILVPLLDDLVEIGADSQSGSLLCSAGRFATFLKELAAYNHMGSRPVLVRWLPEPQAIFLHGQLDQGALLLWVDMHESALEKRVSRLLLQHSEHRVQLHDAPAVGW